MIKNAFTFAIWILSGSIRQGETSDGVKIVKKYSRKAVDPKDNWELSSKDISFSLSVNFFLTALVVPCLTAAAAGQLTAVNASTRPTGPVPAFAVKGEHHASVICLKCPQKKTKTLPSRRRPWRPDSIRADSASAVMCDKTKHRVDAKDAFGQEAAMIQSVIRLRYGGGMSSREEGPAFP